MNSFTTLMTMDGSVISLIILIIIYIYAYRRSDKSLQSGLFGAMVIFNMAMIVVDLLGWTFNGAPGAVNFILNSGFNTLLYVGAPVAPALWLLYLSYQIFRSEKKLKTIKRILAAPLAVNACLAAASLFTGWYFSIGADNMYRRGTYFFVHVVICYSILTAALILLLLKRKSVEKRNFVPLLLFSVPPLAGTLIQTFVYGVSFNWVGMAVSLLIIYLSIQNRGLNTDYLTGAYNRRELDIYTKAKAKWGSSDKTFSALLIDFDGLKLINDTLGHDIGDKALVEAVGIIKKCIRRNDFITRVGGDEFVIIMDVVSEAELKHAKKRIEDSIERFNREGRKPYIISFSYGYGVYDANSESGLEGFFRHLDSLMYRNKQEKQT